MGLLNDEIVLAEIESSYNTDPTPTGAEAVQVRSVDWSFEGLRMVDRPAVNGRLADLQKIYGGRLRALTIESELKGSGAAGTPPEIGALLRACGLGETIVASTSVTYAPVSSSVESCTIYYYESGKRHIITGCRGTFTISLETGGIPIIRFEMIGHEVSVTDQSAPTPTYDSTVPIALKGQTFTVNSYAAVINRCEIAANNRMATPPSIAAVDGYAEIRIGGRDFGGGFDPESVLVATQDFLGDLESGATRALVFGPIGGTAGNIITINADNIYYRNATPGDREGVRVYDFPFGCAESSGDDEFSLAFT